MKFMFDLTFSVELIALGVGVAFLIWSFRNEGGTAALGKVVGFVITILAVLCLIFTTLYGVGYWNKGHFKSPMPGKSMMMKKMVMHDQGIMIDGKLKPKTIMRQ